MWIKSTTAFTDKQAKTDDDRDVPAGKVMNVTADRGDELIHLGLAEPHEADPVPNADAGNGDAPNT